MPSITLFRDFKEDHRTSMEVYADNLTEALNNIDQTDFRFNSYTPKLGKLLQHLPETANLKMRSARYISYPRQAKKVQGDINHIIDHGYAHLMAKLDPEKTIITVHDIIPILAGRGIIKGIKKKKQARLAEWTSNYYQKAARIIAISKNTKDDLVAHCDCDPDRIHVVYNGVDSNFKQESKEKKYSYRAALNLPKDKCLVLITGDAFYKNQETSLKVMQKLHDSSDDKIQLVRLGRNTSDWSGLCKKYNFTITRHGNESLDTRHCERSAAISKREEIIQIDFLSPKQLQQLYNAVDCLLFPSWYEGFGWPPIEAMACGTPVVTSNAASLPEVVGDAAITASPNDIDALADGVNRILEDDKFRRELIEKGLKQAKNFKWQYTANQVTKVYKELM